MKSFFFRFLNTCQNKDSYQSPSFIIEWMKVNEGIFIILISVG